MELDEESKEKLSKQPFMLRQAVDYLLDMIDAIINGKCDEDSVVSTIGTLNQNAQGKFADSDLLNYEESCKILGLQITNRIGLKRLLDRNGIKQVKIKNKPSGFKRSQVLALKDKIDIEAERIKQREARKREKETEKAHKKQAMIDRLLGRKS